MKKFICIFLCLAMAMSLFSGCRETTQEAYVPTGDALVMEDVPEEEWVQTDETQQLSLVIMPEQSMNPLNCSNYTNRVIFPLIYQGLFAVNRDYEVIPLLCQSYTVSEDGMTHEFTIHPRATFSDGTPVTAADAKASLDEAWENSYYTYRFQNVRYFEAIDNRVLKVRLKQAYEDITMLLDVPIVKADEVKAENPLGTGPYILGGVAGNRFLGRRSNWWCTSKDLLITAQRISLLEANNVTEVRDYFEFDDAGIVCTDPGSDWYVDYRCDYELWDCETGIFIFLGINLNSSFFRNQEARQALLKGIDRAKLVDNYYGGFATAAELPASPKWPNYSRTLAQKYSYDAAAFLSMMAAQGAQGRTITLLVNGDDSRRVSVAQEIGRMLNTCGLIVMVEEADGTYDFRSRLKEGNYDLYLGQTKLSANMDLTQFFSEGGSLNYGGLEDIGIYNQCLQALENQGNFYTLHQTVMDKALICPLLFRSYAIYATRGLITQLQPARDNLFCYHIE